MDQKEAVYDPFKTTATQVVPSIVFGLRPQIKTTIDCTY